MFFFLYRFFVMLQLIIIYWFWNKINCIQHDILIENFYRNVIFSLFISPLLIDIITVTNYTRFTFITEDIPNTCNVGCHTLVTSRSSAKYSVFDTILNRLRMSQQQYDSCEEIIFYWKICFKPISFFGCNINDTSLIISKKWIVLIS